MRLVGFGTFSVRERAAGKGRNPATGKEIKIAASKNARFKAGAALKASLNKKARQEVSASRCGRSRREATNSRAAARPPFLSPRFRDRAWPRRRESCSLPRQSRRASGDRRAVSSVGRASRLHREGRRFEPVTAHQPARRVGLRPSRLRAVGVAVAAAWLLSRAAGGGRAGADDLSHRVSFDSTDCGADCPQVIVADGVIEAETPQAFRRFRQAGGAVAATARRHLHEFAGRQRRRVDGARRGVSPAARSRSIVAGFAAGGDRAGPVAGECLSACVYALMGATRRVAPPRAGSGCTACRWREPTAAAAGARFADAGWSRLLARYAARMGVNPAIVWRAESLPPDALHICSRRRNRALAARRRPASDTSPARRGRAHALDLPGAVAYPARRPRGSSSVG